MSLEHIKLETKGVITLADKIVVSDPCYSLGTWCQGTLENMLLGEYICQYEYDEKECRVASIRIHHSSLSPEQIDNAAIDTVEAEFEVGVDSGMAGFFDYDHYVTHHEPDLDEKWYDDIYYNAIAIAPNPNHNKYLTETWFAQHIDKMITELKTYMLPEDGFSLYIHARNYANAILGKGVAYHDTYSEIIEEKLKAAGFIIDIKTLLADDEATAKRENKAQATIQLWLYGIDRKIPIEQRYATINRYTASIIDNKAFTSFSGFGDGGYACYYHVNENNKIDYVEIVFYDPTELNSN